MEGNTIAVLPHHCSVTQGVLVTEAVIVPALEASNIPAPVNMVKEMEITSSFDSGRIFSLSFSATRVSKGQATSTTWKHPGPSLLFQHYNFKFAVV